MTSLAAGACLVYLVTVGVDPNRLPQEEAQRYARVCVEQVGRLTDDQILVEPHTDKACAVRGEGGGAMVVPDRKLSERRPGKNITPVGQLWFRKWTAVAKGKAVSADRLRMVTIHVDDKDRPMALFLLGLRPRGNQKLELVVYANDNEPLVVLPVQKLGMDQDVPVVLEWQRGEKQIDRLTLHLLGKYRAVMLITRQEK